MRPPEEHRGQWGGGVTKLFRLLLPDLFSVRTTQCETQNTAVSESWISGIWQSIKFKPPSGSRRPQAASLPTGSSASAWPQPMMGSPLLPAEPCPCTSPSPSQTPRSPFLSDFSRRTRSRESSSPICLFPTLSPLLAQDRCSMWV